MHVDIERALEHVYVWSRVLHVYLLAAQLTFITSKLEEDIQARYKNSLDEKALTGKLLSFPVYFTQAYTDTDYMQRGGRHWSYTSRKKHFKTISISISVPSEVISNCQVSLSVRTVKSISLCQSYSVISVKKSVLV